MKFDIFDHGKFKQVRMQGNVIAGDMNDKLNAKITELTNSGAHHFVFNLEEISYLDSNGISVFIHCLCDVQENNGSVFLIISDSKVLDAVRLVGLDRLIPVYSSMDEFDDAEM